MTDPIADMLTRLRNASRVGLAEVRIPHSRLKEALAKVLQKEGFLEEVSKDEKEKMPELIVKMRYVDTDKRPAFTGLQRISSPGQRIYVPKKKIPRVQQGLGIAILSTPQGLLTDGEARKQGTGGEVICKVW